MIDKDISEDEIGNEIIELNFSITNKHDHARSIADHHEVNHRVKSFDRVLHLITKQQHQNIEKKIEGWVNIEDKKESSDYICHLLCVYSVESRQKQSISAVKQSY